MAGVTGERPLGDIVTDIEFWKLHVVNIPAIFISGFLFVLTGLAYDSFGTPRPNEYYPTTQVLQAPIVMDRNAAKSQLDDYFEGEGSAPESAPDISE